MTNSNSLLCRLVRVQLSPCNHVVSQRKCPKMFTREGKKTKYLKPCCFLHITGPEWFELTIKLTVIINILRARHSSRDKKWGWVKQKKAEHKTKLSQMTSCQAALSLCLSSVLAKDATLEIYWQFLFWVLQAEMIISKKRRVTWVKATLITWHLL